MATLTKNNGRPVLQFFDVDGRRRRTIRLAKMDVRTARGIQVHVERLVIARDSRQPVPADTARWLGEIDVRLHAKLVGAGLVVAREGDRPGTRLGDLFDDYSGRRTDLKERTLTNLAQCRRAAVRFFGEGRDVVLKPITRAEAADWRRHMAEKLATATVSTHVKKARQVFADAVDRGTVQGNPFDKVKAGTQRNATRLQYVPAADVRAVIAACPDTSWAVVFALARFGGLRTPSETSRLRWSDIDWAAGRMTVTSPKTEHIEGGDTRQVPLFPDLVPYLSAARAASGADPVYVVGRLRRENLRRMGEKIVARAGLVRWPKLYQNLRASCQIDLTARFPLPVVCAWIGNTEAVAVRHYLKPTDADFTAAAKSAAPGAVNGAEQCRTSAVQNDENPRKSEGLASNQYPQGRSNSTPVFGDLPPIPARVVRRALRRLELAAPHLAADYRGSRRAELRAATGRPALPGPGRTGGGL